MKLSIIPEDQVVVIDGKGCSGYPFELSDPLIHAVQWNNDKGHIEYADRNVEITELPAEYSQLAIDAEADFDRRAAEYAAEQQAILDAAEQEEQENLAVIAVQEEQNALIREAEAALDASL
jgi:hypothetical protein